MQAANFLEICHRYATLAGENRTNTDSLPLSVAYQVESVYMSKQCADESRIQNMCR